MNPRAPVPRRVRVSLGRHDLLVAQALLQLLQLILTSGLLRIDIEAAANQRIRYTQCTFVALDAPDELMGAKP